MLQLKILFNGNNFNPCTSLITYNNLNTGDYIFEVRTIYTPVNKDPTPASFSWKIRTPAEISAEQEYSNPICTYPSNKAIC